MPASNSVKERGSVLFIIMIAVALFAALSYVVSQSSDGGGGGQIIESRANTMADDMVLFASSIEKTISRMVQRGISESDLCFDYDQNNTTGYEHAGCNDPKNRIFDVAGGGLKWRDVQPEVLESSLSSEDFYGQWYITAGTRVQGVGTTCSTDCQDIILFLGYLNQPTCKAINRKFNIPEDGDQPPLDDGTAVVYNAARQYTGDTTVANSTISNGNGDNEFLGKKSGCFTSDANPTPSGSYHFYYVIYPR